MFNESAIHILLESLGGGLSVAYIIYKFGVISNKIENNEFQIKELKEKQDYDMKEIRDSLKQIYMILSGGSR